MEEAAVSHGATWAPGSCADSVDSMHTHTLDILLRRFSLVATAFIAFIGFSWETAATTSLTLPVATLPAATGGSSYSQSLIATGGTPPYIWAIQSGALPPGLALDAVTGQVAGTATAATWIYSYPFSAYVRVTDAAKQTAYNVVSIKVNPPAGGGTGTGSGGTSNPSPTPTPPPPTTYSVVVSGGTANGVSSGSFAPGTTITLVASTPPPGQWFSQWNGNAQVGSSFAATTSFTMPANNVNESASFYTPAPVPQPVAGHPRLWITTNDLPRLRNWASTNNPVYQSLLVVLNKSINTYNSKFYPGGQMNPVYPDFGDTQGYTGELSEQHALVFALFSLIDPDPNARIAHAQRARNLLVNAFTEVVKGHLSGAPFRDPMFAVFNRANANSEAWPLALDWIYNAQDGLGNDILSASDKLLARNAFLIWANDCLNAYVCGGDHPSPIGMVNSTALLPGGNAHRVAANNYYAGHARLLTLMSLAIDPVDDPAVTPSTPLPILGNSLRSYIPDVTGAWLYQQFAMFGDPSAVKSAFNLPASASVGLASGGLSPEGGLYGHSFSYLMGEMLALKTAGFADSTLSGPQAALVTSPVWDRYLVGFANSILPAPSLVANQPWMGPIYRMASYGDVLRLWITPDFMQVFALKSLLDQANGNTSNGDAAKWFAVNAVEGGASLLHQRIQQPWSYGVQNSVLYFLLLDPQQPPAADPRPGYSNQFLDSGNGRLLARTDWTPSASMFTFRSSWESINHQDGDAGQFEIFRKGEWLTKELSNYDNNGNGQSSMWHNGLALQNWCANGKPQNLNFFEAPYWPNGSQWNNGVSAGDPVTIASFGSGYAYAQTDMTKLYNRPSVWTPANAALDIQHASRSILWLTTDHVVVYDRAASLHNGFKRFNLNLPTVPLIDSVNQLAMMTSPAGQHLFVQTILPTSASIKYVPEAGTISNIAQLETMTGRLVIEDPAQPTTTRFLHVLEGTDGVVSSPNPSSLVQSTAGTAFDGAVIVDTAVFFATDITIPFQGTTVVVPSSVANVFVTGLQPGTSYGVTASNVPGGIQVQVSTGGQTATADAAGVLLFHL